jgi:hypothetical protein
MPEVSRFYGMVIAMYYNEHNPPHFHVRYGAHRALIEIAGPSLLAGRLPGRALGLAIEWAVDRRDDLMGNWERARALLPLEPIVPLE